MLASEKVDLLRISARALSDDAHKSDLGQFFTPAPICQFMASLFKNISGKVELLDPGCGIGSLFSAFVDEALIRNKLTSINITGYEIDHSIKPYLDETTKECVNLCAYKNIKFTPNLVFKDFITSNVNLSFNNL
jgi:adenine-specific DNA-methyltransferase